MIGRNQRHSDTHKHLTYLRNCDNNGVEPFWFHFDCHEKIVTVHNRVDGVIHGDEEESTGRCGHIGMPAIEKDRDVMIPVEEDKFFLVDNYEECVD
mmetsp:Transcript_16602/g.20686  ORF Transcript_16602/g.20686 Transcript_16602/m.20686 type:complete len:96 (-) Transcript_16602:534-821(-)